VQLASDGSNAGSLYKFRFRARNIHGWGPFSDVASVLAAEVPSTIASASIALLANSQVKFSWQVPPSNGSPVDAYKVEIQSSSGSYLEETTYCGGAGAANVVTEASCSLPMPSFTQSPWSLAQGALILYRVSAKNAVGWQTQPSGPLTGEVRVQTGPIGTPAALILDPAQTDETRATVEMPEIPAGDATATGGSPILSYSLEWDSGSSGAGFSALVGLTGDNLNRVQMATGLTAGASYQFRYRVRNQYGWGPYSAVLTVVAADPPSTPSQPTTTNTGTSARVAWTEPANGGSPITALLVEIRASDGTFKPEPLYCNA